MWSSIKSILKDSKSKCIIVEDGKPAYIVMSFGEYQRLQKEGNGSSAAEENNWNEEKVNGEIRELQSSEVGSEEFVVPRDASTISIEDLPF